MFCSNSTGAMMCLANFGRWNPFSVWWLGSMLRRYHNWKWLETCLDYFSLWPVAGLHCSHNPHQPWIVTYWHHDNVAIMCLHVFAPSRLLTRVADLEREVAPMKNHIVGGGTTLQAVCFHVLSWLWMAMSHQVPNPHGLGCGTDYDAASENIKELRVLGLLCF